MLCPALEFRTTPSYGSLKQRYLFRIGVREAPDHQSKDVLNELRNKKIRMNLSVLTLEHVHLLIGVLYRSRGSSTELVDSGTSNESSSNFIASLRPFQNVGKPLVF